MGVVIKQSFWTSVFVYLGAILGIVNQLFLYTHFMTKAQVGLFSQIQSFAMLVTPLAVLGMSSSSVKFTGSFKDQPTLKKAFDNYLLRGILVGLCIVLTILLIFQDFFISLHIEKAPMVGEYFHIIIILLAKLIVLFQAIKRERTLI